MKKFSYLLFLALPFCLFAFFQKPFFEKRKTVSGGHERETDVERRSGAMDALQFFSAMSAYPGKDIPADAYYKGYLQYKNNLAGRKMQAFNGSWASLGPNNLGGRTLCMAFDPLDTAVIWLGSASGGLWKSVTGGMGQQAWSYIPVGFPVLGVSSMAINPLNHDEMYIGTGETYSDGTTVNGLVDRTTRGTVGMGIFKTTDGGLTWTQSLNWSYQQKKAIWDIVINPLNPDVVYAGTTDGIFKSTDAGITWFNILAVPMAMDLLIHQTDTAVLFAGVGNLSSPSKGLYKTTDAGASWNVLSGGLPPNNHDGRIIVTAYAANNDILMCQICNAFSTVGIYRSLNQGASWTAITPAIEICSYQGWYAKGLLMKPDDSSKVITGGVELFRSTGSGNNFFQVSNINWSTDYMHADVHDVIANPLAPEKLYILTDGGLFRSDDFGDSFYECTDGYVTSQFYIGSVSATDSTMALGGAQDNYTQKYYGNPYWFPVVGGDGSYNAINQAGDYHQLCSYQYLNILLSTDQGNTFNQVVYTNASATAVNSVAFIAPIIMAPSNSSTVYAGGDSIIKSYDGGNTWSQAGITPVYHQNPILTIGVSYKNEDSIYLATVPGNGYPMHVFRSGNGGATLTDITTPNLPDRYPRRIVVNPSNSSEVYLVFSGFGTGHIFRTTDAGNTWTDVSNGLPDVPFHCLVIDPLIPNHVFAGCDYGIFASADAGLNWVPFNDGLPEAVMVFDLVPSTPDRSIRAYTHGNGVYKRSFQDFNTGLEEQSSQTAFHASVFPNPASSLCRLKFESAFAQNARLLVYAANGKRLYEREVICRPGRNEEFLDISGFRPGVYFVSLKIKSSVVSCRLLKI